MSGSVSKLTELTVRSVRRFTEGWASIRALRAYFRGAEYPMGPLEAWWEAYKMVRGGWPRAVREQYWVIMRCPGCAAVYNPPEAGVVQRCGCGTRRALERVEVVPRPKVSKPPEALNVSDEWIKGYQCRDCGITIPEDHWSGPWDERVAEDVHAVPGCPACPYQAITVPVLIATQSRPKPRPEPYSA